MLELNVSATQLEAPQNAPRMRYPTISSLYGEDAYAVKAAVPHLRLL